MKRILNSVLCLALISIFAVSCSEDELVNSPAQVSDGEISAIASLGYNTTQFPPIAFDGGFLVEGDIYLSKADLLGTGSGKLVDIASEEQYHTNNLVTSTPRNITVYISTSGKNSFSSTYATALDEAIVRFNTENLTVTFSRVGSSSGADIVYTRLRKGDERRGILGSAGFPTSSGDPYGDIQMSGILESTYNLSVNGIATIMAHEMGHCIGFRHTDYADRSYSCGGAPSNEGDAGIGANYIPGTATGGDPGSWMLACTDGSNRPFNNNDKTALGYLY